MIRLVTLEDLNKIYEIFNLIKKEMREENNPYLDEEFIDYPGKYRYYEKEI